MQLSSEKIVDATHNFNVPRYLTAILLTIGSLLWLFEADKPLFEEVKTALNYT